MLRYVIRRIAVLALTLVGVLAVVFLSLHLAPGDPISLLVPTEAAGGLTPREFVERLRAQYGLDRPLPVQFVKFLGRVARLDLGRSMRTNRPVAHELRARYPATIELAVAAMAVAVGLAFPVGMLSALRPYSLLDSTAMSVAVAGVSLPSFWTGFLLMLIFAFHLGWLPPSGRGGPAWTLDGLRTLVMPAIALGAGGAGILARLVRSSLLEVLGLDYVRTARAKGVPERRVVMRHALRNALVPVVTVLGLQFGYLLSGAVVVETVFAWPGIGRYMVGAIARRDVFVVQSSVLAIAVTFAVVNLAVDLLYAALDPRIRYD
ncbi:MAG: ABC transporter permease [Armatimonadetes bacterium]|nr:ABC transporter permease [Armatimonadota bacterium]